jgi:hypothetical protein
MKLLYIDLIICARIKRVFQVCYGIKNCTHPFAAEAHPGGAWPFPLCLKVVAVRAGLHRIDCLPENGNTGFAHHLGV